MMYIGQRIGVTGRTGSMKAIACLMACFVLSCQAAGKSTLQPVYTDPQFHFQIACPDSGWTVTDRTGIPEVLCIVKAKAMADGFIPNVTVSVEFLTQMMTAAEYGERNRKNLVGEGYEIVSSDTIIIRRNVFYVLECCNENETTSMRFTLLCLVKDRVGFVLACSAPECTYEQYRSDFERVINSFRFL